MTNSSRLSISLQYYANLREQTGKSSEQTEVLQGTTILQLYEQLQQKYNLAQKASQLRAAANDSFVAWSYQLEEGDDIVFIPPVGGG